MIIDDKVIDFSYQGHGLGGFQINDEVAINHLLYQAVLVPYPYHS